MRKILYIIALISVFILVLTCTACNKDDIVNMGTPNTELIETERIPTSMVDTSESAEKNTDDIQPTESAIVENTGNPINTQSPSQTSSQDTKSTSSNTVRTATAKPSTEKPSTKPQTVKPSTAKPTVTPKPTATPKLSTAKPTISPTQTVVRATADDVVKIADRVIYYINEYRKEQGNIMAPKLTGLTNVAEYRSRQLVTNFDHDTADMREAGTHYKYGEYVEPSLYGMTGAPYYEVPGGEAIAYHSYSGTIDDVAKRFATMAKNSSGHWSYVGSSQYTYIAVGISYEKGLWYCCIWVSETNKYE